MARRPTTPPLPSPVTATDLRSRLRGLYAVTPDDADTPRLVTHVEAAVAGGARAVQYRNKTATPSLRAAQASALAQVCRRHGALFIVNDDARLALHAHADGVHVGEHDGGLPDIREIVGGMIVGVSCYDEAALAQRAAAAGADYIAFGSFFDSTVKPAARRADPALIEASRPLGLPVVGIGGITLANAPVLVAAGVDAVAVISAVFGSGDPARIRDAAARFSALFEA